MLNVAGYLFGFLCKISMIENFDLNYQNRHFLIEKIYFDRFKRTDLNK